MGRVEDGSPAAASGLRVGDRIVQINGVSVEKESHSAIADRIQAVNGLLEILVVDGKSDRYGDGALQKGAAPLCMSALTRDRYLQFCSCKEI